MSEKNETITDIIAEKRRRAKEIERGCAAKMKRGVIKSDRFARELVAVIRSEADRLEAALKRECIEVATRAATQGVNLTNEKYANTPIGNGAKLREALEYVLHFDATDEAAMEDGLTDAERIAEYADHIKECQKKAEAALAAPPRNCERFGGDIDQLREACARERGMNPEEDFPEVFAEWLLAPATEQEEGAK